MQWELHFLTFLNKGQKAPKKSKYIVLYEKNAFSPEGRVGENKPWPKPYAEARCCPA